MRTRIPVGSPDLLYEPADLQSELVADFDDFALSDRTIAYAKLQGFIAGLIELYN